MVQIYWTRMRPVRPPTGAPEIDGTTLHSNNNENNINTNNMSIVFNGLMHFYVCLFGFTSFFSFNYIIIGTRAILWYSTELTNFGCFLLDVTFSLPHPPVLITMRLIEISHFRVQSKAGRNIIVVRYFRKQAHYQVY